MRNTLQHPVTKEEVLKALDDAMVALASDRIGDIRPHALQQAKTWLEQFGPEEFPHGT